MAVEVVEDTIQPEEVGRRKSKLAAAWSIVAPLSTLALLVGAWAAAVELFDAPVYILPSPVLVLENIVAERAKLLEHAVATSRVAAAGLVLAVVIGVPSGIGIARWPFLYRAVMPFAIATQSIPKVALAPLLVVWLGFGAATKLVVVILITFFPLLLGTVVGVQSVSDQTLLLARSMGCRSFSLLRRILMPAAAPHLFSAFNLSASMAIIGALYAEFVGSRDGLGTVLLFAIGTHDTVLAFSAIVSLSAVGLLFYAVAALLTHSGSSFLRARGRSA